MLARPWGPLRTPRIWGWVVRRAEESLREGAPGPQHPARPEGGRGGVRAQCAFISQGEPGQPGSPRR